MAAGDLITRDGQYEYNGLLINSDWCIAEQVEGLFELPGVKSVGDSEMANEHGGRLGRDLLTMRSVVLALGVHADTDELLHQRLRAVVAALQPQAASLPLVWQKAGLGKLYLQCRPRDLGGFRSSYAMAASHISRGAAMFLAPDPRILDFAESVQAIQIATKCRAGARRYNHDW